MMVREWYAWYRAAADWSLRDVIRREIVKYLIQGRS
jgi:hypothetical protein